MSSLPAPAGAGSSMRRACPSVGNTGQGHSTSRAPCSAHSPPVGLGLGNIPPTGKFDLHRVGPNDTLPSIATHYYSGPPPGPSIRAANRYKLDNPQQLPVGQLLRVPRMPAVWPANALQPAAVAQRAVAVPLVAATPPATPTE